MNQLLLKPKLPSNFIPVKDPKEVSLLPKMPKCIARNRRIHCKVSPASAAGIAYEADVQRFLKSLYGKSYQASPWFSYRIGGGLCYAQPDGLLLNAATQTIILIEVKLRHKLRAWWQLRHQYEPIVSTFFGSTYKYSVCEIYNYFNTQVSIPEPCIMVNSPEEPTPLYKLYQIKWETIKTKSKQKHRRSLLDTLQEKALSSQKRIPLHA